jgi:hypothetical protein
MPSLDGFSLKEENTMSETTNKTSVGWRVIKDLRPDIPMVRFMNAYAQLSAILCKIKDKKSAQYHFYNEICELLLLGSVQCNELDDALLAADTNKVLAKCFRDQYQELSRTIQIEKRIEDFIVPGHLYESYRKELENWIKEGVELYKEDNQ